MPTVRLATFNVENLFARFKFNKGIEPEDAVKGGWTAEQTSFDLASPEAKKITGEAIKATKADILCLQEVENLDALKRFRNMYAGGTRLFPFALSIDGNDPRFIDVALLSKYPIVHARSYAHLREGRSRVFSRDCLEVDVQVDSQTLTLFVQHYKSMMGGRAQTRARRVLQVNKTVEIVKDRFGGTPGDDPWVVLGDFNDYMWRTSWRGGRRTTSGRTTSTTATSTHSSTTCSRRPRWPAQARPCRRSSGWGCQREPTGTPARDSRTSGRTTQRRPTTAR
jgi:endonuclease/exonuclease/phosphatase family metal-dependent hydrolase